MALIVEDGTNVPNADSYISEADAITRAQALGLDFPTDPAEAEVPLRRAAMYLEKYRNQYQGTKVFSDQSLQWPRDPVYIDNIYNPKDNIPRDLIDAQVAVASADYSGRALYGTSTGSIASKSVGDVSVTKSNFGRLDDAAYLGFVKEVLKPILKGANLGALEFNVCRA